jgi:hypothetical protein
LREIGHELSRATIKAKHKAQQDLNRSIEKLNISKEERKSPSPPPKKEVAKAKAEPEKKPTAPQSTKSSKK